MKQEDVPTALNLHAISMHLLKAKTCWQNVLDEASGGNATARQVIQTYQKFRAVSVPTLMAYLADLAETFARTPPSQTVSDDRLHPIKVGIA